MLSDRKDAIRDALKRSKEQLATLQNRFETDPPADITGIRALINEVSKCRETIISYEQEMKRLAGEAREHDQRGNGIRSEAARAGYTISASHWESVSVSY